MFVNRYARPFLYLITLLMTSSYFSSVLEKSGDAYSAEVSAVTVDLPIKIIQQGQWIEIGSGSASGEGISNNSGHSTYCTMTINPDGLPVIVWDIHSKINHSVKNKLGPGA